MEISEHVLQSNFWKECKNSTHDQAIDFKGGWFQVSTVPYIKWKIGYAPRILLQKANVDSLIDSANTAEVVFVKIDPLDYKSEIQNSKLQTAQSSLHLARSSSRHLPRTILIDLTTPAEARFAQLDKKARYTIKQSLNVGFRFEEDDSTDTFLDLNEQTMKRQNYYGRPASYLQNVWNIGQKYNSTKIFTTYLNNEPQVSSMVFVYKEVLYYTYAGSSESSRDNNAAYFHVWSLLNWGSENKYRIFDFWGLEESTKDGFSLFKKKFGGEIVEYEDTVDIVLQPMKYRILKIGEMFKKFIMRR